MEIILLFLMRSKFDSDIYACQCIVCIPRISSALNLFIFFSSPGLCPRRAYVVYQALASASVGVRVGVGVGVGVRVSTMFKFSKVSIVL